MSPTPLIPLAFDSASRYLSDPVTTPGQLIGGMLGSTYGPLGAFVGGTLGRMVEQHWSE